MKLPPPLSLAERKLAIVKLRRQIDAYERRYQFDSTTLRDRLTSGEQDETWDVCLWLILLDQVT